MRPLTPDLLQSTDPRDAFLINFFTNLEYFEDLHPPDGKRTINWLLDSFWPTILDREEEIFEKLEHAFFQQFPKNSFTEYLEKFKIIFSRLWWGIAFSHSVGINKHTTMRSILGIPKHSVIETPYFEILQKRSAELEKIIHEMHEQKVAEGKLLRAHESILTAIFAIFNINNIDKIRMITDALQDNVTYPKQSTKMTKITDLFYYSEEAIALALDLMSAYDQVPSTPQAMLHQGATSKDDQGRNHYYVWTGLCQGKTPGPRRCQGHFNFLLDPLRPFFDSIKLYIDDVLTINSSRKPLTDLIIFHKSMLLFLHKLGIRLSPKAYPQLTTTPKYLGYIMDFKIKKAYPQPKHFYKLANLIYTILGEPIKVTFRTYLQLKGVACFIFGPEISCIFQKIDDFIKYKYYAQKLDVKAILNLKMPPHPHIYDILYQITALLNNFDRFTLNPPSLHTDCLNQITIVTDANMNRAGGYLMLNGKDIPLDLTGIPLLGTSTKMDAVHDDYRYKVLKELFHSTTDEERAAALHFTTYILPLVEKFIQKFDPKTTQLILMTDNKPLFFQLNKILNTNAKTNHEIKIIRHNCSKMSHHVTYLWHPRDTIEAEHADAFTRETELCFSQTILTKIQSHFAVTQIQNPLSMTKLAKLQIFDPEWAVNTKIRHNNTLLIFPSPATANKQLESILHFLKFRKLSGIIILPKIRFLQKILQTEFFSNPLSLPKIRPPHYFNIPKSLKNKKFEMQALKFTFE